MILKRVNWHSLITLCGRLQLSGSGQEDIDEWRHIATLTVVLDQLNVERHDGFLQQAVIRADGVEENDA